MPRTMPPNSDAAAVMAGFLAMGLDPAEAPLLALETAKMAAPIPRLGPMPRFACGSPGIPAKPARVCGIALLLPWSSSSTTIRSFGHPTSCAHATRSYCRSRPSRWCST
jgi:hypothetical protein